MRFINHYVLRYPAGVLAMVVGLGFVAAVLMMSFPALRGIASLD